MIKVLKKDNLIFNKILIKYFIVLSPLFLFFFSTYVLKTYLHHDALSGFESFKFFYDYYLKFNEVPLWIPNLANGSNIGSKILFHGYEILGPYFILGKFLNISSYNLYILYIYILFLVYIFGIIKLISVLNIKNKFLCAIFFSNLIIFTNLFFNEIFYTLVTNILIPYYLYYFLKFQKNNKISELLKIFILFLLKIYLFFIYTFITEFYLLFILSIYFKVFSLKNLRCVITKNNIGSLILIFLLIGMIFFNNNLLNENYIIQDFTSRDEYGNIFFENYRFGDLYHLKTMFLTFISGFFWGETSFVFSFSGIFFLSLFFILKEKYKNVKVIKLSLYVLVLSIILSNLWIFPNFVKLIYFKIPLLNVHSHSQYNYLYGKVFLIILIAFGLDKFLNLKFISKGVILYAFLLYFFVIFSIIYLNFIYEKFYPVETLISVNLFALPFLVILSYIFIYKVEICLNKEKLIFLIILSFFPSYFYNLTNYSFLSQINFYRFNDPQITKLRDTTKISYENLYFVKNNLNYKKKCKNSNELYKILPSAKIKEFIPRGSADYSENVINTNIFPCNIYARINIIENEIDLNNLNFNDENFNFSLKENLYTFKDLDEFNLNFTTHLPFSKYLIAKDINNNKLKTFSDDGFLGIKSNDLSELTISYKNTKLKIYILISTLFSLIINFVLFSMIFRFLNKKSFI